MVGVVGVGTWCSDVLLLELSDMVAVGEVCLWIERRVKNYVEIGMESEWRSVSRVQREIAEETILGGRGLTKLPGLYDLWVLWWRV